MTNIKPLSERIKEELDRAAHGGTKEEFRSWLEHICEAGDPEAVETLRGPSVAKGQLSGPSRKPYVREQAKIGRNDPCPCRSGKKFKSCHLRIMEGNHAN